VTLPDGTPLRTGGGADGTRLAQPFTVQPGKDVVIPTNAFLKWTPDGKTLRLNGQDGTGWFWWFEDLKPGRYLLSAEYARKESPDPAKPAWLGKVTTEAVAFEILDGRAGLKESEAVRVKGVDFQAVAEPKVPAPGPGGRQPLDIGLGITNRQEKPLLFNVYDTIRPALRSADGKAFGMGGWRRVSFIPAPRRCRRGAGGRVGWAPVTAPFLAIGIPGAPESDSTEKPEARPAVSGLQEGDGRFTVSGAVRSGTGDVADWHSAWSILTLCEPSPGVAPLGVLGLCHSLPRFLAGGKL
jgi:hypothetical protein